MFQQITFYLCILYCIVNRMRVSSKCRTPAFPAENVVVATQQPLPLCVQNGFPIFQRHNSPILHTPEFIIIPLMQMVL